MSVMAVVGFIAAVFAAVFVLMMGLTTSASGNSRMRRRAIGEGPGHERTDVAAEVRPRTYRRKEAREAKRATDTDLRVELRGFDTDSGGCGCEVALGGAHVATPADQRGTVADGQRLARIGRRRAVPTRALMACSKASSSPAGATGLSSAPAADSNML